MTGLAFTPFERFMNRLAFQGVFGFGVTLVAQIGTLFVNQSLKCGGMRLVARQAPFGIPQRRMLEVHFIRHLLVATVAESVAIPYHQFGIRGGVRIMAAEAFSTFKGCMQDSTASC